MNDTTLIQSAPDDPTAHRRWGHISNNPDDSVRNAALSLAEDDRKNDARISAQ